MTNQTVKVLFFFAVLVLIKAAAFSQSRTQINLDKGWKFNKDSTHLQNINLPHTWNKDDVMDDTPGYYRGACWYRKTLTLNDSYKGKSLFLYFNGANQETEVYINGHKAGSHKGGYTRFCVEADQYLKIGANQTNEIAVKVDNSFNENIPPLSADFTFYGGIYRNVYLVATNKSHFSLSHAANGVFITTPEVSASKASVKITGQIEGSTAHLSLITTISDGAKTVAKVKSNLTSSDFTQNIPAIAKPHLWSPEDPHLYLVRTQLVDAKTGAVLDEITNPLGFRWFKFDGEKGFFLNGKPLKLVGTSRHQDIEGFGNAIPSNYNERDVELIKQMGGNFIRVSHYPQDPKILETCDKLGILASVEIPVINAITENEAFTETCKNMQVEMIRQNFNHPSVVIWAYMNEVLLRPKFGDDKARQQVYFANIKKLAQTLDSLTHKEDPSRYTMIACHGDYNKYRSVGLVQIPQIIGWNLYSGWYGGQTSDFAKFLDSFHKDFPALPVIISEFGADADPRIHATQPIKFDKSVEYAVDFHKVYLKAIEERPFVAGAAVWNLADFNSETRDETMPHINNKGLLTWDRKPKDTYYYYQANLAKKPFVKISTWQIRAGVSDSLNQSVCTQAVTVFSNTSKVNLKVNGINLGSKDIIDGMTVFNVPFKNRLNKIEAIAGNQTCTDAATINFNLIPAKLQADNQPDLHINILLGAKRFYIDQNQNIWQPDQSYKPGSFGSIGGVAYAMKGNSRQSYGTDRNIINTNDDPIYQTQQVGIQGYRFDVPAGRYEITLHFAELTTDKTKEALAYNLDNTTNKETSQERIFDISANDKPLLATFNAASKYGSLTAGTEKTEVTVIGNNGINISFKPIKGEPILNAIQLRRIKD
ncbi:glycoside hydrolase family 2 TIM barrel-domain containing protein [Mucilaginibacter jinjuensis]|uniref:Glycoside hydrolase family 2 TIM barrel-domain containing protein n=1 Tax=Mucilaginibacter jinjuensis TaxID=1176721 RepID=A0ABY7T491_9SPHI|nr:glycoside hydrolase family 2 TIM barrel-domain containing protein [Mucilaginibacter jinjuensis]WCT11156.1 glycoside hydrolase family 2 TIM barrel-domain containing protein [Mucilaginibacter jinjuensis]